ncbi:hypothetical protein BGX26_011350 [Mortierella sp. AD094]|nr:hypothetical protein BGX26_011350 [Mortierella sp. AD094]
MTIAHIHSAASSTVMIVLAPIHPAASSTMLIVPALIRHPATASATIKCVPVLMDLAAASRTTEIELAPIPLFFELRVNASIDRVYTILVCICKSIVLLLVVAAVLAWTYAHGFAHVTHMDYQSRCPTFADPTIVVSDACNQSIPAFPDTPLEAFFTTCFFALERFDSVDIELLGKVSEQFPLQLMVIFFTVLMTYLLINVVIAFMNNAYEQGDREASIVWLQNRLDVIIMAENLIRFIPNYHLGRDYFPKYIIYTATKKEVQEYHRLCEDRMLD